MMLFLFIVFKILLCFYAADFFTGFIHWLEDSFWSENTPVLGKWIIQPNELHHRKPTSFLAKNWWQSSYDAVIIGIIILVIAFLSKHLGWEIVLFVLFSISACQIHKYSHQPVSRLSLAVRFLQKARIIQDSSHHVKHHTGEKNTNYCLISPLLNPVLHKIHFWEFMGFILRPLFGKIRR
jgi:ubiquitin-conjugating enzyme E2 variant